MCDNEATEIVSYASSFYHPNKIKRVLIKSENSDVDENEGLTKLEGIEIKCEIKNEPEEVLVIPEYTEQPETDEEMQQIKEEIDIKYEDIRFEGIQSTEHTNDQSNDKNSLERHTFSHGDVTSVKILNCDECAYQTVQRYALFRHKLTHKNITTAKQSSDKDLLHIQLYACNLCGYKTKVRGCLKNHMLTHKNRSQIQWYKCNLCDFKAIEESYLGRHLLTHNLPGPKIFKYDKHSNQTVHLGDLYKHKFIHDKPSGERHRYKCKFCELTTNTQEYLNMHMRVHKYLLETKVKWYNCKMCNFKSKHKNNFNIHMLLHKDPSEIRWYECNLCDFKAIKESYLKKHELIHVASRLLVPQ